MRQFLSLPISCILAALLFGGCAGLMVSELQDAETMKKGEGKGTLRVMMVADVPAVMRDSLFNGDIEAVAPAVGVSGAIGLTDRLELNAGAWTSAAWTAPATFFQSLDIGVRGGMRYRLTPRDWRHNLALGINAWWHGGTNLIVRFDDDFRYYGSAWGIDPSLLWSWRLSDDTEDTVRAGIRSIYAGGRLSFARADYAYGYSGGDSTGAVTTRKYHGPFSGVVPCLGLRGAGDFYIEVAAMIVEHPQAHTNYVIPSLGIGWKAGD